MIVAHRLSTIIHADQILVIDEGRIVERGNHDELIAAAGKYASMWAAQLRQKLLSESGTGPGEHAMIEETLEEDVDKIEVWKKEGDELEAKTDKGTLRKRLDRPMSVDHSVSYMLKL